MARTVFVFTTRSGFEAQWRAALERHGLEVRALSPAVLPVSLERDDAAIVDVAWEGYDEDELLSSLSFARAAGAVVAAVYPNSGTLPAMLGVVEDICQGLVAHGERDVPRLAAAFARRLDPGRLRRFEFITVSPAGDDLLAVFGDGSSILVRRPLNERDDLSEVTEIALSDDEGGARVLLESGIELRLSVESLRQKSARGERIASSAPPAPYDMDIAAIDGSRLGARLRELRMAAGLTQAELARRTGIHRPNIARVEAGRHTPSLETLAKLAFAIGVPTTRVLAGD